MIGRLGVLLLVWISRTRRTGKGCWSKSESVSYREGRRVLGTCLGLYEPLQGQTWDLVASYSHCMNLLDLNDCLSLVSEALVTAL